MDQPINGWMEEQDAAKYQAELINLSPYALLQSSSDATTLVDAWMLWIIKINLTHLGKN